MKKFEYKVDHCSTDEHHVELIMSRRGSDGWELVSAVLQNQCWKLFWKREKSEVELKSKKASTDLQKEERQQSEWV